MGVTKYASLVTVIETFVETKATESATVYAADHNNAAFMMRDRQRRLLLLLLLLLF